MNAKQRHTKAVENLNAFLESDVSNGSAIPEDEWESRYKQLKGIRAWWGIPWDKIETEIRLSEYPEKWIWESRADGIFKEYYRLRSEIDKMEVLL